MPDCLVLGNGQVFIHYVDSYLSNESYDLVGETHGDVTTLLACTLGQVSQKWQVLLEEYQLLRLHSLLGVGIYPGVLERVVTP